MRIRRVAATAALVACVLWQSGAEPRAVGGGSIALGAVDLAYTQDFNTLASSGTSSVLPTGWMFEEAGTSANTTYNSGSGSSGTGDTYSFGAAASIDRALGGVQSGTLIPTIGASFTNATGNTITSLTISYFGEQWRLGASGRNDRLDFQYSLNATSLISGTFIDVDALDFTAPVGTGTAGMTFDGNANHVSVSSTITGLSIPNGATFWIRWSDFNASGADDGLAIDDFSITPHAAPVPTNPAVSGAASPAAIQPGESSLLTVTVTPGQNPTSSGIQVIGNLSAIGGSAAQQFLDDGTNGDVTPNDSVFSFLGTVAGGTSLGNKSLPIGVSDAQSRTASTSIALTVRAATIATLPFFQDWTDVNQIAQDDNWNFVAGVVGYRGDGLTSGTGTDPRTIVADGTGSPVDVNANRSDPNTFTTGGVAEFDGISNPVVALQGSGTASAPFLLISIDTHGQNNVQVTYNVRDVDGSADNAAQQVALQYRVGNSGTFTNIAAGYVADATEGGSATKVTPISVFLPAAAENQPLVQLRIITTNAVGNDEWVGIDDIAIQSSTTSTNPVASGAANPNAGWAGDQTLLTATVTPGNNPASTGLAVTGDLTAVGGSASQAFFDDGTNGDALAGDNVFSFRATVAPGTPIGLKSIPIAVLDAQNRSASTTIGYTVQPTTTITPIHTIQGSGSVSPFAGQVVTTTGIVTGVKSSGLYIQTPDAEADADPNTSEGIQVFGSPVPSGAAVGNLVRVTGTVSEFVPAADPGSPPLTEIVNYTVAMLSTGNALPAPQLVTFNDINTTTGSEPLERFEGMRVQIPQLIATGPTGGFVNEPAATSTSNGVFHAVMPGVPRPFREPGINAGNPVPNDNAPNPPPANVPQFDTNPERLRIESTTLGGSAVNVATGALVENVVGVVDFRFRAYTILLDPNAPPTVSGGMTVTPVRAMTDGEFTVASFNMERFFDTTDDAGVDDAVLTPTAFGNRLAKASLAIRNVLRIPDIIGVEEMENLQTLQALANQVNSDAAAAGQPNVSYQAFLEEGNDIGGIDVGFLVNASRVQVVDVVQYGKTATYIDPNTNQPATLNDRPPLVLRAIVQVPGFSSYPVTVIVNHLRSLNGVDDPTDRRVRTKRRAQAEFLANLIQGRQTADPTERIISVGDYNAFQFNDGFVDSIGTVKGTPAPPDQVTQASPDLVTPDLVDLVDGVTADQRYSYSFDGNAQEIDHVLVTAGAQNRLSVIGLQYGRMDADFPEIYRASATRPERLSDHDPLVGFFAINSPPVCATATATMPPIFPVDHGQRGFSLANVTDADGDPVAITITDICQDEPPNFENIPQWAVDGDILSGSTGWVRAERSGTRVQPGNGRVYHVFFTGDDGHPGGVCQGDVKIQVPLTAGGSAVDGGPLYDSKTGNACRVR